MCCVYPVLCFTLVCTVCYLCHCCVYRVLFVSLLCVPCVVFTLCCVCHCGVLSLLKQWSCSVFCLEWFTVERCTKDHQVVCYEVIVLRRCSCKLSSQLCSWCFCSWTSRFVDVQCSVFLVRVRVLNQVDQISDLVFRVRVDQISNLVFRVRVRVSNQVDQISNLVFRVQVRVSNEVDQFSNLVL